jgi:hypothetical protein
MAVSTRRRTRRGGRGSQIVRVATTASLAIATLLSSGCGGLFSDGPAEPTRGTLSDAAQEAQKPPAEQKPVVPPAEASRTGSQPDEAGGDEVVVVPAQLDSTGAPLATPPIVVADSSAIVPADDDARFHAGPVAGIGFEAGGVFERIDVFGLEIGVLGSEARLSVQGLYSKLRLDPARGLDAAITGMEEVALDIGARGYLTAPHTFMGAFLAVGYRIGLLMWDWRNPIQVPNDSGGFDEIRGDSIVTHSFHAGFGLSPVQLAHFHLGCRFVYGLKIYSPTTLENLENDLFKSVGFGQLLFDVVYVR